MKSKTTQKKPLSKSAKVTLALIFLVTVALIVLMCFSDTLFDKYTEYFLEKHFGQESVVGDFICQEFKNKINLKGLSEEGKLRECIFIPRKLKGKRVDLIGYNTAIISTDIGKWESVKLKKIYVEVDNIKFVRGYEVFSKCPNLQKIIFISGKYKYYDIYSEQWTIFTSQKEYANTFPNGDSHLYEKDIPQHYVANVTYLYNYDNAPNDNIYWLDDVENNEQIEYIPQNPKREGYKFAGWYKEKDCKNMWSFSEDIVQKATYNTELKENKLFAKWIKE